MKKVLVLFCFLTLCGCNPFGVDKEVKKALVKHEMSYQGFNRDVKAGRTTREQEQEFIDDHANAVTNLRKNIVGGKK